MLLVDTNIISELCRPQPDSAVLSWAESVKEFRLSVVSVEEIAYGLAWRPNPRIQTWMTGFFARHTVLQVTHEIAQRAGELRGRLAAQGSPRTQADIFIAATALVHDLTVATRNVRDFDGCSVAVVNPFSNT